MGAILRAHPVRSESHIQRIANWEVAAAYKISVETCYSPQNIAVNKKRHVHGKDFQNPYNSGDGALACFAAWLWNKLFQSRRHGGLWWA